MCHSCDAQAHGVKAALAQVADVAIKLAEVHLLRLQAFFFEVAGIFVNLSEGGLLELAILGDVGAGDVALPAVQKAPGADCRIPDGAEAKMRRESAKAAIATSSLRVGGQDFLLQFIGHGDSSSIVVRQSVLVAA